MAASLDTTTPVLDVHAGQAVYTPWVLGLYDFWVLGISNRWAWRCPTPRMLALYDQHVSSHHLEVGVGTGYYLERCPWPSASSARVCLLDLNPNSLAFAQKRVQPLQTKAVVANALEPLALGGERFTSIGVNYLLHCLPGDISQKGVVFEHLADALEPGGVVFGATILGRGVTHNAFGRQLMRIYNRKGIFSNTADSSEQLEHALRRSFARYSLEVVGAVALFVAWK